MGLYKLYQLVFLTIIIIIKSKKKNINKVSETFKNFNRKFCGNSAKLLFFSYP